MNLLNRLRGIVTEEVPTDPEVRKQEEEEEEEEEEKEEQDEQATSEEDVDGNMEVEEEEEEIQPVKSKGKQPLSQKDIERAQRKERKSGVIYMSRVPPFMKPLKVRQLLQKYGEIGRIYLIEEDGKQRRRRIKGGGNRKRQFVEGWIEFKNKKYAKAVAQMLNNTPMGGKKHGFYHDDLWNLKYLPKFKWRHLTEQLASERAAKEQKLQTELNQSRREVEAYMKNVERAQKISSIKARREAKIKGGDKDVKQLEDRPWQVPQRDVVDNKPSAEEDERSQKRRKRAENTQVSNILNKIL